MTQHSPHDEGIVKYQCTWNRQPAAPDWNIAALNNCREWLFKQNLMGVNAAGIGFGNISTRYSNNQFLISGSATGHLTKLTEQHYSCVTDFDVEQNHLVCTGPAQASSESMSHGTLYRTSPQTGAVIHVHHEGMWRHFFDKVPTTDAAVPYGTPEMALEIERLYKASSLPHTKFMIMGGHIEGIMTFDTSLDGALEILKTYYSEFNLHQTIP